MMKTLTAALLTLLLALPAWAGGSRHFDHNNDRIEQATISLTAVTVAVWIYSPTATSNAQTIYNKEPVNGESYLSTSSSDNINYRGGSASPQCTCSSVISDSTWTHVAFTHTGTNAEVFVDGASCNACGTITAMPNGTGIIRWGTYNTGGFPFDGEMADLRIYDIVLSDAEIAEIATGDLSCVRNGLVTQLYAMEPGTDPGFPDRSGNGNDGTNEGTTESSNGPPIFWPSGD